MKIGVLGTGMVGQAIATKLVERGHDVTMGSRTKTNEKAAAWARGKGPKAHVGTFQDAAKAGETVFNCTLGAASLEALKAAGAANLEGKLLVDVSNPLDFSRGMPPSLFVANTDSLAEQIQRAFPKAKVVKALNTMSAPIMVDPSLVPGEHHAFLAGNDAAARESAMRLLQTEFGWRPANVLDLGDLSAARGMEAALLLWLRVWGSLRHPVFNFHVAAGQRPKGPD